MVFKFLGKGKKSEYFLEAPPSTNGADTEAGSAKAAEPTPAPLKAVSEALAPAKELVANGAAEVADTAKAVAESTKAKTKKLKKSKAAEAKEASPAPPAPTVVAKPAAAPPPEPVKNFATDHLMPSTMPRRRPGPSMDLFRNMAKDVTPRR